MDVYIMLSVLCVVRVVFLLSIIVKVKTFKCREIYL